MKRLIFMILSLTFMTYSLCANSYAIASTIFKSKSLEQNQIENQAKTPLILHKYNKMVKSIAAHYSHSSHASHYSHSSHASHASHFSGRYY